MNRLPPSPFLLPIFAGVLYLAACAQTPKPKLPAQLQQAERHNIMGITAESRQRFLAAENEFLEAYRHYSAVENYRGMITVLINCSRLYRTQGDNNKTETVLKQAVELLPYAPELETEVCFEMTKLALAKGDNDTAINWVNRGVKSAVEADRGRMLNLQAMVVFRKGDFLKAKEIAGSALKASRGAGDKREEANALRSLGEIAYVLKSFKESLEMYEAALPIDKELAISQRISEDLRGIARSAATSGDLESAAMNYKRSSSVNLAERDFQRAMEDLEMLCIMFERTNNRERLAETVELLEKIKTQGRNPK